jgi:hypothetical protein
MPEDFAHIVTIDRNSRKLSIDRLHPDGSRVFLTSVALPTSEGSEAVIDKFAFELGENLLLDSPAARELLGL